MRRLEPSKDGPARRVKRLINEAVGRSFGVEVELKRYHPDAMMAKARASGLLDVLDHRQMIVMDHGIYDPVAEEFHLVHDTGLFSCLTVTLWAVTELVGAGFVPKKINFARTLSAYRDAAGTDLHAELFRPIETGRLLDDLAGIDRGRFRRFDHHAAYGRLDFPLLAVLLRTYLSPNDRIEERIATFRSQYLAPDRRYVGVCIRGTDKGNEVPATDSSFYIEAADQLLSSGLADRVLIQTDQAQICDLFRRCFGDACDVVEALPRTSGKVVVHRTATIDGNRIEFARNMIAAVAILSTMTHVVTHTGNIGAWITLLRGSSTNVRQQMPEGLVMQ